MKCLDFLSRESQGAARPCISTFLTVITVVSFLHFSKPLIPFSLSSSIYYNFLFLVSPCSSFLSLLLCVYTSASSHFVFATYGTFKTADTHPFVPAAQPIKYYTICCLQTGFLSITKPFSRIIFVRNLLANSPSLRTILNRCILIQTIKFQRVISRVTTINMELQHLLLTT